MPPFPIISPEKFFQPFSSLNAALTAADWKSMPGHDEDGYVPSNTGGKLRIQYWSKRDYEDPNINDLSIGVAWHASEAEAKNYYSGLIKRSLLPIAQPFVGLEMPGCDEFAAQVLSIPSSDNILTIVVRYGNYVFNITVLEKSDGYFPNLETFKNDAKAFDANIHRLLTNA